MATARKKVRRLETTIIERSLVSWTDVDLFDIGKAVEEEYTRRGQSWPIETAIFAAVPMIRRVDPAMYRSRADLATAAHRLRQLPERDCVDGKVIRADNLLRRSHLVLKVDGSSRVNVATGEGWGNCNLEIGQYLDGTLKRHLRDQLLARCIGWVLKAEIVQAVNAIPSLWQTSSVVVNRFVPRENWLTVVVYDRKLGSVTREIVETLQRLGYQSIDVAIYQQPAGAAVWEPASTILAELPSTCNAHLTNNPF